MTIGLLEEARRGVFYQQQVRNREGERLYGAVLMSGKLSCDVPATSSSASGDAGRGAGSGLAAEIAATRKRVEESLKSAGAGGGVSGGSGDLSGRVASLEKENREMKTDLRDLREIIVKLQAQVNGLSGDHHPEPQQPPTQEKEDDEDIDLFGSESEEEVLDADKERIKEERLKAYAAKKEKKPGVIAKSSVILDVKPWDDETDMKEIENHVREITMEGLLWGASKLVPLAYGIKKLQIMCVVEDEKVSIDELTERIEDFEELVQSVDIAAFNKI